ncbi:MAG: TonB-dependent receptor, partial [Gammaproteobacteria bacterium]|nr:TonB-dependent receptor [Gammaproteobacteria bacterium]
ISTRQTAEVSGSRITLNRGEDDIADVTLRHAGAVGEVDYRITLGYQQDNGFDNRPDDKHVRMATLHADYSPTLNDSLEFQAGYNGGPREEGFPTDSAYPEGTDQIHSHFEQFKWQHQWSPYSETNLHFYHNYQKTDEYRGGIADLASGVNLAGLQLEYATTNDISEDNFAILPIENSTKAERFDLELSHLVDSHDGNWRLVLGASARRDNVSTPLYLGTNETLENRVYRLFSNLEWRLTPRLITNAGAMLENNDITGTDLSPRLAFNYRLNPSHTLRTSVSKALRTPVQVENRADYKLTFGSKFVSTLAPFLTAFAPDVLADLDAKRGILTGPGDLKPEKIVSREIGYLGTFPDYGLDMDIRLFYDSISNIIQSV